jgi:hypothetical protein
MELDQLDSRIFKVGVCFHVRISKIDRRLVFLYRLEICRSGSSHVFKVAVSLLVRIDLLPEDRVDEADVDLPLYHTEKLVYSLILRANCKLSPLEDIHKLMVVILFNEIRKNYVLLYLVVDVLVSHNDPVLVVLQPTQEVAVVHLLHIREFEVVNAIFIVFLHGPVVF